MCRILIKNLRGVSYDLAFGFDLSQKTFEPGMLSQHFGG